MAIDDSAQPQNSDNRVFHGREATVRIGDALDEVGTDKDVQTQLDNATGSDTDFSGILTEITLTDPEAGVDVQNTFGGQVMTESPHDLVEIEFTARFQDLEMVQQLVDDASSVGTTDFQRTQGGTQIGNRPNRAILFRLEKDGDVVQYLANNAIFSQMGEVSLAGDGAAEITGTAHCRVADLTRERNFGFSTS